MALLFFSPFFRITTAFFSKIISYKKFYILRKASEKKEEKKILLKLPDHKQ